MTHLTQAAVKANVQFHTHQLARSCAGRCGGRASSCGCGGLAEGPQAPPAALQDAQRVRGGGSCGRGGRRLRRSCMGSERCTGEAAAEPQAAPQAAGSEGRQRRKGTGRAAAACGRSAIRISVCNWYRYALANATDAVLCNAPMNVQSPQESIQPALMHVRATSIAPYQPCSESSVFRAALSLPLSFCVGRKLRGSVPTHGSARSLPCAFSSREVQQV